VSRKARTGESHSRLAARLGWAARWLADAYALEVDIQVASFVLDPESARSQIDGPAPRSGVLAVERGDELRLGIYLDPQDAEDPSVVFEEASHWLCLAWHAVHDRPISALALEFQADVDRFLFLRGRDRDPLAHLIEPEWSSWTEQAGGEVRARYRTANSLAFRYCRQLASRYPERRDTPSLLHELRGFYRASPQMKVRAAG
jgi:hypothetical protein